MPKITGPTIAQHVADQEAAVFNAATRLFTEHGVDNVSIGAIADEVGLARPSLYRYFPNKASIVLRWFEQAMDPLVAESDLIARSDVDRCIRFDRWIQHQIRFLLDPANRAMISATLAADDLTDEQRHVIARGHRDLYTSLRTILADVPDDVPDDESMWVRTLLIVDLLRGLDRLVSDGVPIDLARYEVLRATRIIAGVDLKPLPNGFGDR